MAIGIAEILQQLCRVRVQVITVCGVFSGNGALESVNDVAMVLGSRDPVAALGRIAYPGRLPLLPLTNWNRWHLQGAGAFSTQSPAENFPLRTPR